MKNTLNSFEMTPEAKRALSDFFAQLRLRADKCAIATDVCEDLVASLDEHISCALRDCCDRRRVEVVDAQSMLEVLLALGTPDELVEALDTPKSSAAIAPAENVDSNDSTGKIPHHDYAFPRYRVLKRSSKDRWLMGVCGGFAEYWGVSSLLLRILMLFSGIGVFAYIIIGLLMPPDDYPERAAPAQASSVFSTIQTALKGIFVIFMFVVLYMPMSAALLSVAFAGFCKILSGLGIAGWQSNDLWFYFATGIPGYLVGLSALLTGLGFFALLTQYFATTFFNRSLLNINTRRLATGLAVTGLIVLAGFWLATNSLRDHLVSDSHTHTFAASSVRAINLSFPGSQMPFYRKAVQLVGEAGIDDIKIEVTRRVGGRNENQANANLESLSYLCEISDDGKLKLGGDIDKPAWSLYPFPDISFLIRVPEQQLLKIECDQRSGVNCDLDISGVSGPINADLQSGKVRLDSISSPEISVKTQVGDIDARKISAGSFAVSSNVGKIRCDGVNATNARIKSDVGAIRVENFTGEELNISSEVGTIRLEKFSAQKTSVETRTGSINLKADSLKPMSVVNLKSDVGSVKADLPADSNPVFTTRSGIGRIQNAFKSAATASDSPQINIITNVGSIRVNKMTGKDSAAEKEPIQPAEADE